MLLSQLRAIKFTYLFNLNIFVFPFLNEIRTLMFKDSMQDINVKITIEISFPSTNPFTI